MVQKSCDHQLRLAVYQFIPFNFEVLYIQTVVGLGISGPSTFSFSRCLPKPAGEWPQGVLQFDFFVSKAKGSPHMADRTSTGTSDSCFGSSSVLTTLSAAVPRRVATCFPVLSLSGSSSASSGRRVCSWHGSTWRLVACSSPSSCRWLKEPFGRPLATATTAMLGYPTSFLASTLCVCGGWPVATSNEVWRCWELARSPVRQFALFYIPCQVLASVRMPATSFGPLRGESFFLVLRVTEGASKQVM